MDISQLCGPLDVTQDYISERLVNGKSHKIIKVSWEILQKKIVGESIDKLHRLYTLLGSEWRTGLGTIVRGCSASVLEYQKLEQPRSTIGSCSKIINVSSFENMKLVYYI